MIRLFEIKLKIGQKENTLKTAVCNKLGQGCRNLEFKSFQISGKSIDARKKKDICFVYNIDFEPDLKGRYSEEKFISDVQRKNKKIKLKILSDEKYSPVTDNRSIKKTDLTKKNAVRPIVTGFGPAGIFAGLYLAYNGFAPLIIERGKPVEERVEDVRLFWEQGVFDPDSNPLFGEGGAGTFSDGKLTTGKSDKRIRYILEEFVAAGAPDEILYIKNPHIGTDVLRNVVRNLRNKIISFGGEIIFESNLEGINIESGALRSIKVKRNGSGNCNDDRITEELFTQDLILATGHSARDTYEAFFEQGLVMEQKPFSIGLRIEHDQAMIDRSQYGSDFEDIYCMSMKDAEMPPAEYKLSHRLKNGRGVYTFCMCPGGEIITTSAEKGTVSVNGMSEQKRDGDKANSALLVDVRTSDYNSDDPLAGMDFQREYERRAFVAGGSSYKAPVETVADFMSEKSVIAACLPDFAVEGIREALPFFGRKLKGFDSENSILKGIESGSSSLVRIPRNDNLISNIDGIYPCGEGAGYAGGITSAAIDGLKCAEQLVKKYTDHQR